MFSMETSIHVHVRGALAGIGVLLMERFISHVWGWATALKSFKGRRRVE